MIPVADWTFTTISKKNCLQTYPNYIDLSLLKWDHSTSQDTPTVLMEQEFQKMSHAKMQSTKVQKNTRFLATRRFHGILLTVSSPV